MTKLPRSDVSTSMPAKVALLLLLALALTACGSGRPVHADSSDSRALAPPALVAYKTQLVDTHGIQLAVPAAWKLNEEQCGTPTANTVVWLEDGMSLCLIPRKPGLSVVEFGGPLRHPRAWYQRHAARLRSSGGVKAWIAGYRRGSRYVELIFPRRHISVTVYSPHAALVRRIVRSMQLVDVNTDGCPTRPQPSYRLGSPHPSAKRFVPGGATRLVGCSYADGWLDTSSRVGSQAARRVARAMSSAPRGFSRPPRGSIARSECAPSWRSFSVAYFRYPNHPPVKVTAHLDGCSHLGASNGRWGVQMSRGWVPTFTRYVAWGGSFSDVWS